MIPKQLLTILLLLMPVSVICQTPKAKDFYASIKKYDLSKLWCADSFLMLDAAYEDAQGDYHTGPKMTWFVEPLGFIGTDYQRFYMHYLSVTKSKTNPYMYFVAGKTRVKENICSFNGTITIKRATLFTESDDSDYKQGAVYCVYKYFEDTARPHSGIFSGKLETSFMIDKKNNILYDAIMLVADGYSNNECTGTWKSYKTKTVKKCNWGDFRIPNCGDLDGGTGLFLVMEKYAKNGWENYMNAYGGGDDTNKRNRAIALEDEQWWK